MATYYELLINDTTAPLENEFHCDLGSLAVLNELEIRELTSMLRTGGVQWFNFEAFERSFIAEYYLLTKLQKLGFDIIYLNSLNHQDIMTNRYLKLLTRWCRSYRSNVALLHYIDLFC